MICVCVCVHFVYSSSIQPIPFPHIQLNVQLPHLIAARAHFSGQPVYPWQGTPSDTEEEEAEEEEEEKEEEKGSRKKKGRHKTGKTLIRNICSAKKKRSTPPRVCTQLHFQEPYKLPVHRHLLPLPYLLSRSHLLIGCVFGGGEF